MIWLLSSNTTAHQEAPINASENYHQFLISQISEVFQRSPMLANFLVRFLHIPDYAKNYIQCHFKSKDLHLVLPILTIESLNILLYTMLGTQIKSRSGLTASVQFSERSPLEQTIAVVVGVLALLQLVGIVAGIIYTSLQYRAFAASQANRRQVAN
jgi:hypothetical protein